MAIGIRNFFRLAADQVFTSNATLANITGFVIPVAVGQIINIKLRAICTVGATGGLRAQFISPGSTDFNADFLLLNSIAAVPFTYNVQLASAVFADPIANAGNHLLIANCSASISVAGNFSFQMAQNTVDVLSLTVQQGSFMDVTLL